MARTRTIQNSFNSGEFSPKMEGRTDLAKYANSAKTIENLICLKHGGVTRRPGTHFVAEVKTSTKKTRLIPFIFSSGQAYILEFGDLYIRFYKNGARIENPPGTAVETTTTYTEDEVFDIQFAQSADVLYLAHHNHFPAKLSRTSDTSWQWTDLGEGGDRGYLAGPFLEERTDFSFTPSATAGVGITITASDPFFTVGHVGALLRLLQGVVWGYAKITSVTSSLVAVATTYVAFDTTGASDAFQEGAWMTGVADAHTYVLSSVAVGTGVYTGTVVATSNALKGLTIVITGFTDPANNGTFKITANNGTTTITTTNAASVSETHAGSAAVSAYLRGFPSTVTLFQQRLWWASTANDPDTIWGSQTSDYENYDEGTALDNEACTFVLSSNRINTIQWIVPLRSILAGTTGSEWSITGAGGTDTPITPGSVFAKSESTHGSNTVAPIAADNAVLFLQRAGLRIRELTFQFQSDSYVAPDLTLLNEEITIGGVRQMDFQEERLSVVWAIRADGTLLGMTYERPQDVVAWHRHVTDGEFESVAVIPHPTAGEDQTWVVVKRFTRDTPDPILDFSVFLQPDFTVLRLHVTGHGFIVGDSVIIEATSVPEYNGTWDVFLVIDADYFIVHIPGIHFFSPTGGFVTDAAPVSTKRYVEYLDTQSGYYDYLQVDSGLTYSGAPTATLTGLGHLEGKVVDVLGNGSVYPSKVVASGQVTGLSPNVTEAEVGIHFDSTLLTMRPEIQSASGTIQNTQKRFSEVTVRLFETIGVTINGQNVEFRSSSDPMDEPVPPFTGDKRVTNLGWDTEGRIEVKQTQPLPMTVLAVIGVLNASD